MAGSCVAQLPFGGDAGLANGLHRVGDQPRRFGWCLERVNNSPSAVVLADVQDENVAAELPSDLDRTG
jgi:hypothetical protein